MRGAAAVLLAAGLTACVPHPVGPARSFGKYEGKAVTTAKSALSAVQTARLTAKSATRHRLFGPYVGLTLGEAEDDVAGLNGREPAHERHEECHEHETTVAGVAPSADADGRMGNGDG